MANNCLYQRLRKEVSYDGGYTYEPTGEYVVGDLLEEDSFECSYMTNYVFTIPNVGREASSSITSGATNLQYQVTSTKNGQGATYSIVSPAWMSVEKTWSGVSIDVQANGTGTDRNATVRLIQDDSGLEIHIFIAQVSDQSGYVFCFNGGASSESLSASTEGGSFSYNVVSTYQGEAQPFSVTSSPAWLTASLSGNVLSITMGENTGATKTGNVVLTQSGSNNTITLSVVQDEIPITSDYLTFVPIEDGFTFKISGYSTANTVSYSTDKTNWTTLARNTFSPSFNSGTTIYLKATNIPDYISGVGRFTTTKKFNAMGNPLSMLYGDNFRGITVLHTRFVCMSLFSGCTNLVNAENISLPATTLAEGCYGKMFYGCTSLATVPALPATTLADGCYGNMFDGCTSLTGVPSTYLPATTLNDFCYQYMFAKCIGLTTAPALPATTLAHSCYANMFEECASLTTAPALPATTLAPYCYSFMFSLCTSLTTAPELPATTLAESCYEGMFAGCSSLTTAPVLPAITLDGGCYDYMFDTCSSLNSITCLANDDVSYPYYYTKAWVYGVANSGTFYKNPSMTGWSLGENGIPDGWTVQDYNP